MEPERPAVPDRFRPALEACAAGSLAPNVALLRLAMEATDPGEVEAALVAAQGMEAGDGAGRLGGALALWRSNPQAFGIVKAVLLEHDAGPGEEAPDAARRVAGWADAFDRLAEATPEGGVALYALGNPDLLRAVTGEVVGRLRGWGVAREGARVLEVGCGIGRFVAALSPLVGHVTGLDIAPGMVARARERCAGLPNVALAVTSGRDLSGQPDGTFDAVLAADVFPYLVQAGGGLAARHVHEAARVLAPGGQLAILNFSYRGDPARDREEVRALAAEAGLEVRRVATGDFALWDAATFLLRRP